MQKYHIEMNTIKDILIKYTKNIKINLNTFTAKKNIGDIDNKNIDIGDIVNVNKYFNFNFTIEQINIDYDSNVVDLLNNNEKLYSEYKSDIDKCNKCKSVKYIKNKILDSVL